MDKKEAKALAQAREGKFTYEAVHDVASLTEYLKAVTEGFSRGAMHFSRQDLAIDLHPKGLVNFTVEAKAREGRMKLNLKFVWSEHPEGQTKEEAPLVVEPGQGS